MKCPICKGKGNLSEPERTHFTTTELNAPEIARTLRKTGLSIRQIAKIMGFKHPGSINNLLT